MCSLKGRPKPYMSAPRISRLRQRLDALGLGAMYVRDTSNIAWLTAFRGVFDEEQAHAAFVSAEDVPVLVHTDSRYATAMEREATDMPIEVESEAMGFSAWAHASWVRFVNEDALGPRRLGIEDSIPLAEYRALERAFDEEGPFVETKGLILGLRAVKDDFEIRRMKSAQALTDAAFAHIIGFMEPGMTERDVQLELDWFMLKHGADGLAFQTIIACGGNGASPHALVSDKRLEAGQCVVMDFGARFEGYCSDMTRTVFLGQPEGQMRDAWECIVSANESVEAMLRPGVTGKEAHELALSILASHGFEGRMGHGLGHGVGLDIHEEPVLSLRNDEPLRCGNVVTVEPGIYLPGSFGMRLEDFGVITDGGFEVFTESTHDMVVI